MTTHTQQHNARRGRSRRGSTIIFAVGVLAVLAIVAVSYTIAVRLDRASSMSYARRVDYSQQVKGVVGEIQATLTADLFGNKIVSSETPRRHPNDPNFRVWPRMFEDGEFFDAPSTAWDTLNQSDPDEPPSTSAMLDPTNLDNSRAPRRDDMWLASTEPYQAGDPLNGANWDTWRQITNLRGAYRWDQERLRWVRGDGRFADLAQFFRDREQVFIDSNRADPGAPLSPANDAFTNGDNNGLPGTDLANAPGFGLATQVFDLQLNAMYLGEIDVGGDTESLSSRYLRPYDTRFWTDTDGDLRPDARWQQLDSVGDLFGLRWVVATRIIDNSALVNINSSLLYHDPQNTGSVGIGYTPADVDLWRLLRSAHRTTDLRTDGFWASAHNSYDYRRMDLTGVTGPINDNNDFVESLTSGFGFNQYLASLPPPVDPQLQQWQPDSGLPPTRAQREVFYRFFGDNPFHSISGMRPYPIADEIDLRGMASINFESTVAKFEQWFDADARSAPAPGPYAGPVRGIESESYARNMQETANPLEARPSVEAIRDDTRRLLTTVSGVGAFSPVPVLNPSHIYDSRPVNTKVRLIDFPVAQENLNGSQQRRKDDAIRRAFETFVWALAPLSTNIAPMAPIGENDLPLRNGDAQNPAYHYGGRNNNSGPAEQNSGASYAILRAASLAVNLADALDEEVGGAGVQKEIPTIARLYNIPVPVPSDPAQNPTPITVPAHVTSMGVGFSFGDISSDIPFTTSNYGGTTGAPIVPAPDANMLPASGVSSAIPPNDHGVTLVGLDRQPFLREVATVAVYGDRAAYTGALGDADGQIDPQPDGMGNAPEQYGSIIAFEIGNPWTEPLFVEDYSVALADGVSDPILVPLANATLYPSMTPGFMLQPGEIVVFFVAMASTEDPIVTAQFQAFVSEWTTEMQSAAGEEPAPEMLDANRLLRKVDSDDLDPAFSGSGLPVLFHGFDTDATVALLLREVENQMLVVDRLASASTEPFPAHLNAPLDLIASQGAPPSGYQWTGRQAVFSSMRRQTERPAAGPAEGFPAYVIERPSRNLVVSTAPDDPAHGQHWLVPAGSTNPGPAMPLIGGLAPHATAGDWNRLGMIKEEFTGQLPSFQLFVPNIGARGINEYATEPPFFLSDILRLCAFAHEYRHQDAGDPEPFYLDGWTTISEHLGAEKQGMAGVSRELQRLSADGGGVYPNPYMGVLDPTRYIPGRNGDMQTVAEPPDAMAVPLATRVLDGFEALSTGNLTHGRININTAPEKVLRVLPLMDPEGQVSADGFTLQMQQPDSAFSRVQRVRTYRDRVNGTLPGNTTGLLGLREGGDYPENPTDARHGRGFVSVGELAILDNWRQDQAEPVSSPPPTGFLETIAPGASISPSVDLTTSVFDLWDATPPGTVLPYEPQGDPEERMALFRAISHIVSTRSDVFTAWFEIRGYRPALIEQITIDGGTGEQDLARYMGPNGDEPWLEPEYSARWLAVFDRSNVRSPLDRPRVLLLVQVPD